MSKGTYSNSNIHTLMAVAAMQGADQHIKSSLGVQNLAKGHFDIQTRGIEPTNFRSVSSLSNLCLFPPVGRNHHSTRHCDPDPAQRGTDHSCNETR